MRCQHLACLPVLLWACAAEPPDLPPMPVVPSPEQVRYQEMELAGFVHRGPLARQILRALDLPEDGSPDRGPPPSRAALEEVYRALAVCLGRGEIFGG